MALALTVLCLHFTVSAQSKGSQDGEKPPSQSPSVGTGGPVTGPTGLFTIYDGSTIRKGELTFSIAYSNYDRDPGSIVISDTPLSFNVGLNDHLILFFETNEYRGIEASIPKNRFSFFLRQAQPYLSATKFCVPACTTGGQPLKQFLFVRAKGPTFNVGPPIAPAFPSVVGASFGGDGRFGAASNLSRFGSPFGGVFPGIVLTRHAILSNLTFNTLVVPDVFSIALAYSPDARSVNRLDSESSFNYMAAGAKIRLTVPNDASQLGFLPFYGRYPDQGNDFSWFNQMPRGAGPGADIGDVGVFMFPGGRRREFLTLSANLSYILNANPMSDVMGGSVLRERPDELLAGAGFDFVASRQFQAIADLRSRIFAGQAPNAWRSNSAEPLERVRVFRFEVGITYGDQPDLGDFTAKPDGHIAADLFAAFLDKGGPSPSSSAIAFLSSPNLFEPRAWDRSSSDIGNDPLRHLSLAMFLWGPKVTEDDRQRFRPLLERGPEDAKIICAIYGDDSSKCRDFRKAIEALGPEGVDNGVTLAVGPVQTEGAGAETSVTPCGKWNRRTKDNPTGQRTTITITEESVNSGGLIHMIRHEGSHVADGWKWRASGCKRSSNPFLRETEFKAYTVASLSAEAYQPNVPYEFVLRGGSSPGKNPFLPETVPIYRPDLKAEDLQILRDSNIDKLLARPKNAGGLYGVTATSPGKPVFGFRKRSNKPQLRMVIFPVRSHSVKSIQPEVTARERLNKGDIHEITATSRSCAFSHGMTQ
jgi:hypothetical protein